MLEVASLPERTRNRVLRRVDWQYLLPQPAPRRVICFSRGLLEEAVAAIAQVSNESTDGDLAVAERPSMAVIEAAFERLRPGGTFYSEWSGGPDEVRPALEAAGFEDIEFYRPWPSLSRARCWVPMDDCAARRHFLSTLVPLGPGALRKVAGIARAAEWVFRARAGIGGVLCAISRKPGTPQSCSGPQLLLTGGPRSTSKVVRLEFSLTTGLPSSASKMARVPEAVAGLARESEVLQNIAALSPNLSGVPRVLAARNGSAPFTLVETPLIGSPLYRFLTPGNYRAFALRATHWLADLARETRHMPSPNFPTRETALWNFVAMFGEVVPAELIERSRRAIEQLVPLPSICEQRDFSPWNVLITRSGGIAVLDWESAEPNGLPGMDMIYFLTYLGFYRDRALNFLQRGYKASNIFRRSYRRLLGSDLLKECFDLYASSLGLNPSDLAPIRMLAWMVHAGSDYRRFSADSGGKPSPDALRRSLFLSLWEEEVRIRQ